MTVAQRRAFFEISFFDYSFRSRRLDYVPCEAIAGFAALETVKLATRQTQA